MDESWEEALDLDDSDLPALRSLKRQNHHHNHIAPTAVNISVSQPFLRRCSLLSQSSQTLPSQNSQFHPPPPPPPPPPNVSHRLIPGPAGTVQAAMQRRKKHINEDIIHPGEPNPTQEYIRMAVEDGGIEDDDFNRNPWLYAVDFVRCRGLADGDDTIGIPLSAIKCGTTVDKVSQVVAIVKSCNPNGLGDMMVTLKDPTGTIDASIHRRVLTDVEFGKDISIGAVIILQKVAVFSPSRSSHYLNITLSNIVKVISKDGRALLEENHSTLASKAAAPDSECNEKSLMPHKSFSLSQGRTEGIMNSLRQNASAGGSAHHAEQMERVTASRSCNHNVGSNRNQNAEGIMNSFRQNSSAGGSAHHDEQMEIEIAARSCDHSSESNKNQNAEGIMNNLREDASGGWSAHHDEHMERENTSRSCDHSIGSNRNQSALTGKEYLSVRQDVTHRKNEVAVGLDNSKSDEVAHERPNPSSQARRGNILGAQYGSASAGFGNVPNNQENRSFNGTKRKQPPTSRASLPQWTDEQLDELFAFD